MDVENKVFFIAEAGVNHNGGGCLLLRQLDFRLGLFGILAELVRPSLVGVSYNLIMASASFQSHSVSISIPSSGESAIKGTVFSV